jgi:hypothetical protein
MNNQIEHKILADIRTHGFTIIGVGGEYPDTPGFTYTVGLALQGIPEQIIFAMPAHYAAAMFNDWYADVKAGKIVPEATNLGEPCTTYSNLPVHFIKADKEKTESNYTFQAKFFHEEHSLEGEYMQWVWPDRQSNFPWDENWDKSFDAKQPILGSAPVQKA